VVDFATPDEDFEYVEGVNNREPFNIKKDECHWLIQTKCDVPVLNFSHDMSNVSQLKAEELVQYDPRDIQGAEYEENEVELENNSPDDYIRLSYIEYSPATVQDFQSKTI